MRLLVTWPFQEQGRVVDIPLDQVESIEQVEFRAVGGGLSFVGRQGD